MNRNTGYINTNPYLVSGLESLFGKDSLQKAAESKTLSGNGEDTLEKGKSATVGETRNWNGKNYKKQPNGKWLEISEHGLTKKQHNKASDVIYNKMKRGSHIDYDSNSLQERYKHEDAAEKLSDKEHSDEEVGLGVGSENDLSTHVDRIMKEASGHKDGDEVTTQKVKEFLEDHKEYDLSDYSLSDFWDWHDN